MKWETAQGEEAAQEEIAARGPQDPEKPQKRKKRHGCLKALGVVAVLIVALGVWIWYSDQPKNIEWPTAGLATMLPKPSLSKGEVKTNTSSEFSAELAKASSSDYQSYVSACQEQGFTVDADEGSTSYDAFNSDGYELELTYYGGSLEEIDIDLTAPVELGTISWPTSGVGALVPAPTSTTGKVSTDSTSTYSVLVGETTLDDYSSYVDACIAAGFDVDYTRNDKSFSAENAQGVELQVRYKGANRMSVYVYADEDARAALNGETTSEPEETVVEETPVAETQTQGTGTSTGVTPAFKATMDSYEAFMNEYVDFMEKYENSDNALSMMADYTSMMTRYAEWADTLDDYDEETMTAADLAYYLEVMGRVNQRLLELSQ